MKRLVCLATLSLLFPATLSAVAAAADWPQFRGPEARDIPPRTTCRWTWSETENIAWKGRWPASVGRRRRLPAIRSGSPRPSTKGTRCGPCPSTAPAAGSFTTWKCFAWTTRARSTPTTATLRPRRVIDGDRVYVHFGAHGTACLSTDGQIVWKTKELEVRSPPRPRRVARGVATICCSSIATAATCSSSWPWTSRPAQIRWKRDRQHISQERKSGELPVPMAYCTPLLLDIDGRTQLVSLGSDAVVAYEPSTGEEIWWFGLQRLFERLAAGVRPRHAVLFNRLRRAGVSRRQVPAAKAT